jgi:hypothetical protein
MHALERRTSSTMIVATFSSSTSAPRLFSAFATADSSTFLIRCAAFLSLNCEQIGRARRREAAHLVGDQTHLLREMRAPRGMALASIVHP